MTESLSAGALHDAEHLAKELLNGDTYDCGPAVVYGWRVGSGDPTDAAASLLLRQRDEILRLRDEILRLRALVNGETIAQYPESAGGRRVWQSVGAWLYPGDRIVVMRGPANDL